VSSQDTRSYEERNQVQLEVGPDLRDALQSSFGLRLSGEPRRLTGGEESANWRVRSDTGDLVVRIRPSWRTTAEVRWIDELTTFASRELPEVACPLRAASGGTFVEWEGHCVSVYRYAEGNPLDEDDEAQRDAAARLLARVHATIQRFPERDDRPVESPEPLLSFRPRQEPAELNDRELDAWYAALAGEPRDLIHGDFYPDNIIWDGTRISALLDWDEAHVDYMNQEIAWAAWEFSHEDDAIDSEWASAFLKAYADAGGVLPATFETNAINFVRMRLRGEMRMSLARRDRGEPFDDEYHAYQLRAFGNLKGRRFDVPGL
jgi:Ser/Thr protein kinase RdoA (MazF antagonist)